MKVRSVNALSSIGLSTRYCRLAAVNVRGSAVGCSCVATFHCAGASNVTRAARASSPRAHISDGGNIQVRVRRVDREMRSVEVIAEHLVADAHRAAMRRHIPLRRIRTLDAERPAGAVVDLHVVHIPRKFVDGVAPGRCARHHHLERARRHVGKRHLDLHPMMLRFGKTDVIRDRCLCVTPPH